MRFICREKDWLATEDGDNDEVPRVDWMSLSGQFLRGLRDVGFVAEGFVAARRCRVDF